MWDESIAVGDEVEVFQKDNVYRGSKGIVTSRVDPSHTNTGGMQIVGCALSHCVLGGTVREPGHYIFHIRALKKLEPEEEYDTSNQVEYIGEW